MLRDGRALQPQGGPLRPVPVPADLGGPAALLPHLVVPLPVLVQPVDLLLDLFRLLGGGQVRGKGRIGESQGPKSLLHRGCVLLVAQAEQTGLLGLMAENLHLHPGNFGQKLGQPVFQRRLVQVLRQSPGKNTAVGCAFGVQGNVQRQPGLQAFQLGLQPKDLGGVVGDPLSQVDDLSAFPQKSGSLFPKVVILFLGNRGTALQRGEHACFYGSVFIQQLHGLFRDLNVLLEFQAGLGGICPGKEGVGLFRCVDLHHAPKLQKLQNGLALPLQAIEFQAFHWYNGHALTSFWDGPERSAPPLGLPALDGTELAPAIVPAPLPLPAEWQPSAFRRRLLRHHRGFRPVFLLPSLRRGAAARLWRLLPGAELRLRLLPAGPCRWRFVPPGSRLAWFL